MFSRMIETKVIGLDAVRVDQQRINDAAAVIDGGGLVGFPTETVYGIACRASAESLSKLDNLKGREAAKPYTLHIAEPSEAARYVPRVGLRARKLIEKAWPGPLSIVFELDTKDIDRQKGSLKPEVFQGLYRDNSIGIRCPDNAIAAALLGRTSHPVVAPSANMAGEPPAVDAEGVMAAFSGRIDLVLDGGRCKYGGSSTVVKIGKGGLEILRAGVYAEAALNAMSEVKFLLVCTGNTCRSPMAEGIFQKYLAEKVGCSVDRLGEMGYNVSSAGVMDMAGFPASEDAVAACAAKGVDIAAHRSRGLTRELIEGADYIFVMEQMHRVRVVDLEPEAAGRCMLLAENDDIADPIGQGRLVYSRCADLIEESAKNRIGEFVI